MMRPALLILLVTALTAAGCTNTSDSVQDNPLLSEWNTPFGVPPFDEIEDSHYLPAYRMAMQQQRDEIEAIVSDPDSPTFSNTIEALERSGSALLRVNQVFNAVNSAHSNDAIRSVASTIAPELSAHGDDINLNKALFDRVNDVYEQREGLELDSEQHRLLDETYKQFVRGGIGLDDDAQARLREINSVLAELTEQFGQNLLAETNDFELHVTEIDDLGNLPEGLVVAAAEEAVKRGNDGGWSFTLSRPSINPFLQYSPNRELRRRIFDGYAMRGNNGNEHDNNEGLARIARLRAERATLMGYDSHAHFILSDNMAETPERVYDLLNQIWEPALRVAKSESDALEEMMRSEGIQDDLKAWDWRHYSEKVRKALYDLDEEELRPYFEFTAVRDGAFILANRLFGIHLRELDDMPLWHPDQQVFEVTEADGSHLGILYMDFFTRESKSGGAWMNELRDQSTLDGDVTPIITNNFNFPPPAGDAPSLLSFTDASTLFHEFGHALHGLFSKVRYRSLSGTNVPRDFVEFPSQVMENWMSEPEVMRLYAKHYQTGEVIPDELIDKIRASNTFNQGFITVEYMAASYLDMAYHTSPPGESTDPRDFERAEMDRFGLIDEIIPRYRSTYFSHIFGGDPSYSSGYYSYLWSEVLDADAFEAFKETSLFDQDTASRYRHLLSQGGSRPGMELYEEFRGRAPVIDPLLVRRGLK